MDDRSASQNLTERTRPMDRVPVVPERSMVLVALGRIVKSLVRLWALLTLAMMLTITITFVRIWPEAVMRQHGYFTTFAAYALNRVIVPVLLPVLKPIVPMAYMKLVITLLLFGGAVSLIWLGLRVTWVGFRMCFAGMARRGDGLDPRRGA
jgi:hypothetical protein